jgi:type I restriction enzyme M protein
VFSKLFNDIDTTLKVDFSGDGKLIYPTEKGLKIEGEFTTNLSDKENFVVFECVNRLFEKGYKPEHITLEPKWQLGHGGSGGRADILVRDNSGKALLMIECKTEGSEFKKAWQQTQSKPTQLFSYAQQERSTQFICLYASDLVDNQVKPQYFLITLKDNKELLEQLKDKNPLSFAQAQSTEEIYKVWKETYKQDATTKGLFEKDIQAYHIGKKVFSLDDLNTIGRNDIQGKYHEFATILRKYNVSGRENAFDKLVNLFLCKVVDETENPNKLEFYWKGIAYDNYFDLQDRLQKLYQQGMKQFLGEEVTYIDNQQIKNAFRYFKNDPDATQDTILNFFKQLKFFTNNDFAFIDVHNEKLFYQNAVVLLDIVKMLQDVHLKAGDENQFLGDMFEGFLDQGVKQSEGQFFTPMPIVKFILNCLPLEKIITESQKTPKAIDYACGAGHFLNEYAKQIKPLVETHKEGNVSDYYAQTIGIEKEYRLSKVAKVSSFMYGQDEIKIVYADALAESATVKDGDFAVLVANPPYSVKGFLETLPEADHKRFELIDTVEPKSFANNNSIETFFIERAKQLLQPNGVAAIIVPSSIISKGSQKNTAKKKNIYVATREILLKYFDIVAIAEFGKGTFGKTGTNTVTLFLRRKVSNPAAADHFENRVNTWFKSDTSKDGIFADEYLIKHYCQHIDIAFDDYKTLLQGAPNPELLATELYKEYQKEFEKSPDIVAKKKQRSFKELSADEQKAELHKLLVAYLQRIEKDKLYYFVLASQNPQEVLILKAPTDGTAEKKFLGYEWSFAKGKEGIKYLGNATVKIEQDEDDTEEEGNVALEEEDKRVLSNLLNLSNIKTPLYDPADRYNSEKINTLIQANFNDEPVLIPESLQPFVCKKSLVDMLDFNQKEFSKAFSLAAKSIKVSNENSKWDYSKLGDITEILSGGTPSSDVPEYWDGDINWVTLVDSKQKYLLSTKRKITAAGLKNSSAKLLPINTVIFSSRATIGDVTIAKVETATNQGYKNFICDESKIKHEYLYYLLNYLAGDIADLAGGMTFKEISKATISNFKIPLPPPTIQTEIVEKCEAIDAEAENAEKEIEKGRKEIADKIAAVYNSYNRIEIDKIAIDVQYGINEAMNTDNVGYKIFRMNEIINKEMFDNGSMKYANISETEFLKYKLNKGDILFNRTNSIEHVGKTGIFLLDGDYCYASYLIRVVVNQELADPYFVNQMMNSALFQEEAKSKATKSINQANINANIMKNIKIPVPASLTDQQTIVSEIQTIESKIKEARKLIDSVGEQKQAVMKAYL